MTRQSESHLVKTKWYAELELIGLGRKPKRMGHGTWLATQGHIADGTINEEQWYVLIDYRDGNKIILKRAFSRLEAYRKNLFLKGTGKAWANVGGCA